MMSLKHIQCVNLCRQFLCDFRVKWGVSSTDITRFLLGFQTGCKDFFRLFQCFFLVSSVSRKSTLMRGLSKGTTPFRIYVTSAPSASETSLRGSILLVFNVLSLLLTVSFWLPLTSKSPLPSSRSSKPISLISTP